MFTAIGVALIALITLIALVALIALSDHDWGISGSLVPQ